MSLLSAGCPGIPFLRLVIEPFANFGEREIGLLQLGIDSEARVLAVLDGLERHALVVHLLFEGSRAFAAGDRFFFDSLIKSLNGLRCL